MQSVFLEILIRIADLANSEVESRDEIDDPLHDALTDASIGEVSGGGSGMGLINIDVDIYDQAYVKDALAIIRDVLQQVRVPRSTVIKQHDPVELAYAVYE